MKLAVIPGDGIGTEVITQAMRVLQHCIPAVESDWFNLGANRYLETGQLLTDQDLAVLSNYDAILLGAIGDPRVQSGILERGFLLRLRFAFDHHINLRPAKTYPGVAVPINKKCDLIVVREGTEGLYIGNGGTLREGTSAEIATEISINTRFGVERVITAAFAIAQQRNKKLTLVHKTNVLAYAGSLWQRCITEISPAYPDVEVDYCHIDAAMIHLLNDPNQFDVIVTDNLFGDIITDLTAAITGGIGLAASANINSTGVFPSMFEPVHGSAPDIAGTNQADPIAAILSVALLCTHSGYPAIAQKIEQAVATVLLERGDTILATSHVGDMVIAALR